MSTIFKENVGKRNNQREVPVQAGTSFLDNPHGYPEIRSSGLIRKPCKQHGREINPCLLGSTWPGGPEAFFLLPPHSPEMLLRSPY
jgi:hypothetical protein